MTEDSPNRARCDVSAKDVLVVVVTFNSGEHIARCLRAAWDAGLRNISVFDNDSTDDTIAAIESCGVEVDLHASPINVGFAAAVNAAVHVTNVPRHVLCLNPDCEMTADVLAAMVETLSNCDRAGVVAPGMANADGSPAIAAGRRPSLVKELVAASRVDEIVSARTRRAIVRLLARLPLTGALGSYAASEVGGEVREFDWVSGFCMLIRHEVWVTAKGLDELYFLYFEDTALCAQARRAGWRVYSDGRVRAVHTGSASSTAASKRKYYRQSMWRYFRREGTPIQRAVAKVMS